VVVGGHALGRLEVARADHPLQRLLQELLQRFARQLIRVGVRLAQDLGVLDVVERRGDRLAIAELHSQRLKGALAEIDPPNAGCVCGCHDGLLSDKAERRAVRNVPLALRRS